MPENSSTLILKGDSTHLVGEQKKFTQEVGKGVKEAEKTAAAFDRTARSIGKTLLGAGLLKQLLQQTGQAIDEASQKMAALSKSAGGTVLRRDQAAARLGITSQDITASTGVGGKEAQAGLLESLAGSKALEGTLSAGQINQALSVGATGTFSNQEILSALENGQSLTLEDAKAREATFSPAARLELDRLRKEGGADVDFSAGISRDAGISRAVQRGKEINAVNEPIKTFFGINNRETILGEVKKELERQSAIMRAESKKLNPGLMTDSQ